VSPDPAGLRPSITSLAVTNWREWEKQGARLAE